ncbi:MAG: VOC family protein [Sphingopyxis sp.]
MTLSPAKSALDVGVVVSDLSASLAFYSDLLGLAVAGEIDLPFGKLVRLSFGDSFLKLLSPTSTPQAQSSPLTDRAGIQYITFQISNIDDANARITAEGVPVDMPLQELIPGLKVLMIRDPDGNIVELIERL